MSSSPNGQNKPAALALLSSERPRDVGWLQAAGLLFGDWGTSRLYVLGLAFLFAGRSSFWLVCAMSGLILAVGWGYSQICRIYPDGGGVYTAARSRSRTLAVVGALLLFADYTVTVSLSVLDGFHYFGLPLAKHVQQEGPVVAAPPKPDAGDKILIDHQTSLSAIFREKAHPFISPTPTVTVNVPDKSWTITDKAAVYQITATPDETLIISNPANAALFSIPPPTGTLIGNLNSKTVGEEETTSKLLAWDSPGLWSIVAIIAIGLFNLMGPKHSAGFAVFAALGMVFITLLITFSAIFKVPWHQVPQHMGHLNHSPGHLWVAFVSIVLALSGVEAIANLTGVMRKPVFNTASKAIWVVALEVAVFNILLALFMIAIFPMDRESHKDDMLAVLSGHYVGHWGEIAVRVVGGLLLLSAGNTAVNGLMSIVYVVSRDGELPAVFQKVNRFGAPWVAAILAAGVPILILLISHDVERLADLYAIGVVGAVAINITLCAIHPRLRRMYRKIPMFLLGVLLLAIWVTLACTKLHALIFVSIVMVLGLTGRWATKWFQGRRGVRPSLLRQAINEQLTADAIGRPKLLIATYGSDALAHAALAEAKRGGYTLIVCFIRQVTLSYKHEGRILTIDTDLAALRTFSRFLDQAHEMKVPILPVYDMGSDAAELIAETAAIYGTDRILIGTSRQGALYHLLKGHFQRKLEGLLPPEIHVDVIAPDAYDKDAEMKKQPVEVAHTEAGHS